MIFSLAIAATAGAVVYSMAINTNAQPADVRAARTVGTVKNRIMTCGKPAVPIIKDAVKAAMFKVLPRSAVVYS